MNVAVAFTVVTIKMYFFNKKTLTVSLFSDKNKGAFLGSMVTMILGTGAANFIQ